MTVTHDEGLFSVSCSSSSFCAAEESAHVVIYTDGRWGHPAAQNILATSGGEARGEAGISCTQDHFCAYINTALNAGTYDGHHWQPPISIDAEVGSGFQISCPNRTFCMAVDRSGEYVVYKSGRWLRSQTVIHGTNLVTDAVSCPSIQFCAASSDTGNVMLYDGTRWDRLHHLEDVGTTPLFMSVSCPAAGVCVAVDTYGNAFVLADNRWSGPVHIDSSRANSAGGPYAVSCATATFCVALDLAGNALTYRSGKWSKPSHLGIDNGEAPAAISCPTEKFCMAVGGGQAFVYS